MKRNNMFKCPSCEFSGAPATLGVHYKTFPLHRKTKLGRPVQKTSVDLLQVLSDPSAVYEAIASKIRSHQSEIALAQSTIEAAKKEIKRLEKMQEYFSPDKLEVHDVAARY